jgi:hypothetical protein
MTRTPLFGMLLAAAAAGCAADATGPSRVVSLAACRIAPLDFPSAVRDFDRGRSTQLLSEVEKIARADRQALAEGAAETRLGRGLESLGGDGRGAFVAHDVAELAVRLRQLDCAVLAGGLRAPGEADRRYDRLLAEIEAARHAFGLAAR